MVTMSPPQLTHYWTKGAGLARWAPSPHPYTTLVGNLRMEGVPRRQVHGLAANYFKIVFGVYPGQRPWVKNKKNKK